MSKAERDGGIAEAVFRMMSGQATQGVEGFYFAYGRDAGEFRFYVCAFVALAALAALFMGGGPIAAVLAVFFGGVAYHFFPLIEKSKARIGAGQYGIFIDGFGIIDWRAVKAIKLRRFAVRSIDNIELHIELSKPLDQALLQDWHKSLPLFRALMMLPWKMTPDGVVRIPLEPFGRDPNHIHARFMQTWRLFGRSFG